MNLRWIVPLLLVHSAAFAQSTACFTPSSDAQTTVAACSDALQDAKLPAATRHLALSARANAYVALKDTAKALADFDAALILAPHDIGDLMGRARARETSGALTEAERDYAAIIAADPLGKDPLSAQALSRRGTLRIARGDVAGGIDDLGEARRLDPRNPEPLKLRAAYFLRTGDLGQAVIELSTALSLNGNDIDALLQRATAYARQQNLAFAIADFTTALKIAPANTAALEGRGVALLQNNNAAAAAADFSALLALKPDDVAVSFLRANARLQLADWPGADADYTHVLAQKPKDGESLLGRALARQFVGNYAGADADLSAILAAQPDAAQALATRGHVRFMAAKFSDAAADYAKALTLPNAPNDLMLWQFLAIRRSGSDAPPAFEKMPANRWPTPIAEYLLGSVTGDVLLTQAQNSPDPIARLCEVYFYLGEAALLQNNAAEAAKLFRAALSTNKIRFTEFAAAKAEIARIGN